MMLMINILINVISIYTELIITNHDHSYNKITNMIKIGSPLLLIISKIVQNSMISLIHKQIFIIKP